MSTELRVMFVLLLAVVNAQAHDPFDCSSRMTVSDDKVEIVVTTGLDAAKQILASGGLSSAEVAAAVRQRGPYSKLELPIALAPRFFRLNCEGEELAAQRITSLSDGMEVTFALSYSRPSQGALELRAVLYDSIENLRRGSFVAHDEGGKQLGAALFSQGNAFMQVTLPAREVTATPRTTPPLPGDLPPVVQTTNEAVAAPSAPNRPSFGEFFKLGVEHILTGFDHLLFLAALLVGVRKPFAMLGVITCFTLAHSVTLALAALDLVMISSRIIEPLIAASIIAVCIENFLRKDVAADRFWLAGGFGLIHGFGFAGALRETGLAEAGAGIAMPLFSFNLGVETGQLAVAALFLPALFLMRRWRGFSRFGIPAISTAVIMTSSYWFLERTLFYR